MKVSLITTVLNEEENIKSLLKSVIQQKVKPDEFIIVDGGSKDNTLDILKSYSRKYKWIKIYLAKGASIGKGRNIAISKAKNNIIAVTDAGCVLDKGWLREIVKPFEVKNVDVVVGIYKANYVNDFEYFQGLVTVPKLEKIFGNPSRMSIRSMAFKKSMWETLGGLPESYGGDDTKFNILIMEKKYKIIFSKNAIVYWKMRKNWKDFFKQYFKYGIGDWKYRNILKLKKNFLFVFILPILFVVYIYLIIQNGFWIILLPIAFISFGAYSVMITRKIKSILFLPSLYFVKRIAYLSGAWYGIFREFVKR
jgi:cellulose synthase/poly-beta-1,6-N-acetylglucosamine synthase-like glycosyltransferase